MKSGNYKATHSCDHLSKVFLIVDFSNEVAQFLNLSVPECRAILDRYDQELSREVEKIKER